MLSDLADAGGRLQAAQAELNAARMAGVSSGAGHADPGYDDMARHANERLRMQDETINRLTGCLNKSADEIAALQSQLNLLRNRKSDDTKMSMSMSISLGNQPPQAAHASKRLMERASSSSDEEDTGEVRDLWGLFPSDLFCPRPRKT